jgi:hypothetical protein
MNGIRGLLLPAALALLLSSVFTSRLAHAAGIPESVVIVVNADSWISRAIAHEYRALRGIPPTNLIEVGGLSNFEQIGVDEFRERILRPVLAAIADRQLSPQIDYVVYSADLPTAIDIRSDLGQRPLPRVFTPTASINGLTYLHQAVLDKDPRYVDFQANHYARRVRTVSFDSPWTPAEVELYAKAMSRWESHQREIAQANQPKPEQPKPEQPKTEQPNTEQPKSQSTKTDAEKAADTARATRVLLETTLETLRGIEKAHPRSPELLYNIACSLALLGKSDDAMKALDGAVAAGWLNHQQIERDRDFESLRGRPDYKTLLEKLRDTPIDVQPTIGFQARRAWTAAGDPLVIDPLAPGSQVDPANTLNSAAPANLGAALAALQTPPRRYLLSTVLAVTRGRGLSVDESLANLRRSVAADGSRPTGTIYIERNGDVRSTTREWAFRGVVRRLETLGVRAVVEAGVLPKNRTDVAGAVIGIADFQWPASGSEILPGAIVEHLTSFGGVMTKGAGQTPLVEFLRHGAAGASGTVTEPFAIQAKFPTPFIHVYYAEGCTLAESFYQAVSGPYQLLVVGDALCRPWARPLTLTVDGQPIDGARLTNKLELAPRCESTAGIELAECRLYVDGRLIRTNGAGKPLTLDPALIDGGPHEATVVAIGNDAVRTVARRSFRFETGDPARTCQARVANDQPLAWEQTGRMALAAIGAQSIELLWGTRSLGRIEGPSGEVALDPRSVGPGLMRLHAMARYADNTVVRSPVVELRVLPPANNELPVPRK